MKPCGRAIAAGQLEAAEFGASGFAGAWLDCHCIEPVVVPQENDGTTYYYSVMVTRKDSGIDSLEKMKGHSLAFADPNSTSGYLIQSATLKAMGIDLTDGKYFSRTGFAGGHEQGVVAVLNKQYDGAVTWTSAQGDKEKAVQKWEYTWANGSSATGPTDEVMKEVNRLGNDGWELVTVEPATAFPTRGGGMERGTRIFHFRRPK